MRTCPLCKSTYPDEENVCPVDGSTLDTRSSRLDATATIEPPTGTIMPFASFDPAFDPGGERTDSTLPPVAGDFDSEDEKTRQDRPAHRRVPRPPVISARTKAPGAGRSETSELERNDFSALLSSEPDSAQLEPPEARIGKVVGSYRLLEIIGRGGMGCVYRAEHVKLGRDVALKLLREDYAQRRDAVTRFFQEARAVNLIRHRNIVDVIDYVELGDGTVFIIMELLAGQSLGGLMRGPIELGRAIGILAQICDGLSAAHAVGIVHRDLKPDNIIIVRASDGGDLVKVLDFGVAKLIDKYSSDPDLTAVGAVIGTPAYMSPEQAGGLAVDPRADVYALGAIMYELFTKQPVFRASTFGEFVRRHLNETPKPARQQPGCEQMDPELEGIIMRCLEKSPDARYRTALELRAGLLGLLADLESRMAAETRERDRPALEGRAAATGASKPATGKAAAPRTATPARPSGQRAAATARPSGQKAAAPPPSPTAARAAQPLPGRAAFLPTPAMPSRATEPNDDDDDDDVEETEAEDEATIEVPRDGAIRRLAGLPVRPGRYDAGSASPTAAPPRTGAAMPRQTGRSIDSASAGDDPAWLQGGDAPRSAPLAYGTPSPPVASAAELLRRSLAPVPSPRPPLSPSALSGKVSAPMPAAMGATGPTQVGGIFEPILEERPPPDRGRFALIMGAMVFVLAGALAVSIPLLTSGGDEEAQADAPSADRAAGSPREAASGGSAAAGPSPAATPAAPESEPAPSAAPTPPAPGAEDDPPDEPRESARKAGEPRPASRNPSGKEPGPIRVRVVSRPVGELYAAGRRGALCETPCALTINPGDGNGGKERRLYVVKRPGYKDRAISIDLASPPRVVRVELDKLRSGRGGRSGKDDDDASEDDPAPADRDESDSAAAGEDTTEDSAGGSAADAGDDSRARDDQDSTFNPYDDKDRADR